MMKHFLIILTLFLAVNSKCNAQSTTINPGDKAQSFVLTLQGNSTQGINMPYLNRIVLLHFWSSSFSKSKVYNKSLNKLTGRYKNAMYRNAEGFETIAIAVQSDKTAWNDNIKLDTLTNFINGIASRGYNDDICKKYGVNSVPTDILIDETGTVIAVNPRITLLEDMLDAKKNFQPVKKDVVGTLAMSSNSSDFYKFAKLYLFNAYGDSIAKTLTNDKGQFTFSDIKLNQDFVLKVDNGADIVLSDPVALFNSKGERVLESKTANNGFVFYIPSNLSNQLTESGEDIALDGKIEQVDVSKNINYKGTGAEMSPKDEQEMKSILEIMTKNKNLVVEVITHTSTKLDSKTALALSQKQSATMKNYLVKKGIAAGRITSISKGNTEPRRNCKAGNCSDEDHLFNQRTQFKIFKN